MKNGFIENKSTIGILVRIDTIPHSKRVTIKTEYIDILHRKENQSELERIYELLECRTIDIVRNLDNDIYIDDEGLFVSNNPVIQFTMDNRSLQIAGTFLFSAGVNIEGDTIWFNKNCIEDLTRIKNIENSLKDYTLLGYVK